MFLIYIYSTSYSRCCCRCHSQILRLSGNSIGDEAGLAARWARGSRAPPPPAPLPPPALGPAGASASLAAAATGGASGARRWRLRRPGGAPAPADPPFS